MNTAVKDVMTIRVVSVKRDTSFKDCHCPSRQPGQRIPRAGAQFPDLVRRPVLRAF
jgi:hypothetical protein